MDSIIIINWVSPLSFLGVLGVIFNFYLIFLQANRIAPDGTPRSAASHLGLFCLPMSHKKNARLKRVKAELGSVSYGYQSVQIAIILRGMKNKKTF